MAILIECPSCKNKLSLKRQVNVKQDEEVKKVWKTREVCPSCGCKLQKGSGRIYYWIEFYLGGKRRRERIGPNKSLAETILHKRLVERAEGRLLDKKKEDRLRFNELSKWYLNLSEVKAKKSYERDERSVTKLNDFFGSKLVREITPSLLEAYRQHSLTQLNYKNQANRPATVNREMACLKTIFSKALKNGKIEKNPAIAVRQLKEDNERNRVLSSEEWRNYKSNCPSWYLPIAMTAFFTAMRRGEILSLTPSKIDLKEGFIRLKPEDTKTGYGRSIPIHPELMEVLQKVLKVRPLNIDTVFHKEGVPIKESTIREAHEATCKKAGIGDFRFHDLRHVCINNWRRQGHDYFKIMAASGHKTMSVFKRYNAVDEAELKTLVTSRMDTYMDTKGETEAKIAIGQ